MYKFTLINTRNPNISSGTLGIEVTVPEIAAMCDLGNIDEQHSAQGGRAACEVALTCELPPDGATIGTIRPDLDALCAMAILALRRWGWEVPLATIKRMRREPYRGTHGEFFEDEAYTLAVDRDRRIKLVAAADAFVRSEKWQARPLPTSTHHWCAEGAVEDRAELASINRLCFDRKVDLATRVACCAAWILKVKGFYSNEYRAAARAVFDNAEHEKTIEHLLDDAERDVLKSRLDMIAALNNGTIAIAERNGIAVVCSEHPGAIGLGQCVAPVVVAENPSFRWPDGRTSTKYTISFYNAPGVETMTRIRDALNLAESRATPDHEEQVGAWGGNLQTGILGSPQGRASSLRLDEVEQIVRKEISK